MSVLWHFWNNNKKKNGRNSDFLFQTRHILSDLPVSYLSLLQICHIFISNLSLFQLSNFKSRLQYTLRMFTLSLSPKLQPYNIIHLQTCHKMQQNQFLKDAHLCSDCHKFCKNTFLKLENIQIKRSKDFNNSSTVIEIVKIILVNNWSLNYSTYNKFHLKI